MTDAEHAEAMARVASGTSEVRSEHQADEEPDDLPDSALPAARAYVRGVIAELDEHGWRKARAAAADPETEAGQ
jgi:hypothetical protein